MAQITGSNSVIGNFIGFTKAENSMCRKRNTLLQHMAEITGSNLVIGNFIGLMAAKKVICRNGDAPTPTHGLNDRQ